MKTIEERAEAYARVIADTVTDEWNFRNFESVITLALEELAADLQAEKEKELEQAAFSDGLELRGIIRQIREMFGETAKTSDDGSVQEDVLALKAPDSSMRSQTPRTDAAERDQEDRAEYRGYLVPARFARVLERELNAATRARLAELDFPLECVRHLAGCACQCQRSGIDVDKNRHVMSCMVGRSQSFLGQKVEIVSAYEGPRHH